MKGLRAKIWIALALIIGIALGAFFFGGEENPKEEVMQGDDKKTTTWTCSMHPQIKTQEPGQCPICGMDLIPMTEDRGEGDPMAVRMSTTAAKLANIQTIVVGSSEAVKTVRLNGKVVANERLVKTQSSHVNGRIEELLVNTTGEHVKQGQKLASIYSPELITAQQELLQVAKVKTDQPALYKATAEKLRSLKVSQHQINEIETSGKINEEVGIYADQSGIVLNKKVNVGDYLQKGETLFTIADLSKVWVVFDAYEGDLNFIKEGDDITFKIASIPGRDFTGKIVFINPTVNPQTRVTEVRVEVNNPGGGLKPEMFAVAEVQAELGTSKKMVLPKSAVMWTGERSVVYVQDKNAHQPSYRLREISLGSALGDAYTIDEGLMPGERVVVNGTFTVDAAAQLAGKPSMMNPQGGVAMSGHNHTTMKMPLEENVDDEKMVIEISPQTKSEISSVLQSYFVLKDALIMSDRNEAAKAASSLGESLNKVNMGEMGEKAHFKWMNVLPVLQSLLTKFNTAANIDVHRKAFLRVSEEMVQIAETFGPFDHPVYILHCPMADNNKGGDWLSASEEVMNPYYGDMMLRCGDVKKKIE